jgi:hypothetical protein
MLPWHKGEEIEMANVKNPDTPILRLSHLDNFTLPEACAGVLVVGGIGLGKTSGSGKMLAGAFLRPGMGGLVTEVKSQNVTPKKVKASESRTEARRTPLTAKSSPARGRRKLKMPFVKNLDTRLLQLSRGDYFTLTDACQGVHIFGGIGSGKTSGSGKMLAGAYLRAGFGGLVTAAKPEEVDLWIRYASETRAREVPHPLR